MSLTKVKYIFKKGYKIIKQLTIEQRGAINNITKITNLITYDFILKKWVTIVS